MFNSGKSEEKKFRLMKQNKTKLSYELFCHLITKKLTIFFFSDASVICFEI
jgi:hypothetical protein